MKIDRKNSNLKIMLFWEGFPVCGLLTKKLAEEFGENLTILATRPTVPFEDLEKILDHKIIWLDDADDIWKNKEKFNDKNLIIHTGWKHKGWLKYDRYMKKNYRAKIVVLVDNRYRGDVRQFLGAIYFRLFLKKYFDAVLVPGKDGQKLMHFLGMNKKRIYTGLYGAYEEIFRERTPIENRNKEFLFVGQLIKRKSVDVLVKSFKDYKGKGGTWNLRIIGSGPLENICNGEGIILENFAQPYEIVKKMNNSRVLILPSRDDNWGTVVCEAAACGMQLITSKRVGSTSDIVKNNTNGFILPRIKQADFEKAFFYFENLPEAMLINGSKISKEITNNFNSQSYLTSIHKIIEDLFI